MSDTSIDIKNMIDELVNNAHKALKEYMTFDQEQINKIVHKSSAKKLIRKSKKRD